MFDPDKAINSCNEDKLNRCNFAKSLGEAIINYKEEESLVIGLLGKWGYGKTSIINMAMEHMAEITKNDENSPILIEFNPWIFSNQNQLVKKFFDEFGIKIKDDGIKDKLKTYVNKLIPPIIGLASVIDPARTRALIKSSEYFDDIQSEEESLESIKNELNDLIAKKSQRIIVIIDDIDRLSDFEIQQIFQLVKLLADFPNTIYLLSFDKKVVIKALGNVQRGSADKYLDKIVQIPFEVPKIHKKDIEQLLFGEIDKVIYEYNDKFDQKYWGNLYHSGLKYFFSSIRDVKRYINTLKFNFEIIKDEVNPVDFLAIIAIQIFAPKVYQGIRNNKNIFSGAFDYSGPNYISIKEQAKIECDEIIKKADLSIQKHLNELLNYMFPRLNAIYGNTNYGNDWLSTWRKELRICSPEKFEIYFRLSINEDEISQSEINNILSSVNNPELFTEELLKLNENGKIIEFLELLEDYTQDIHEDNIENVISVLMDIGDLFPDIKKGMFDIGTPMRVSRVIHQLLQRFNDFEDRFKILEYSMVKSKNSLFTIVQKVAIEDQVHGKYGLAKNPSPKGRWTVDSEQLIKLEKIAIGKIHEWAKSGHLAKHEHFVEILFDWKRWEPEETITFVNKMIDTDEGLIKFLTHFLDRSTSFTLTDKVSNSFWTMNIENIESFVKSDELEPKIRNITSSSNFEELEDINKLAISCFLKKMDNRN